MSEFDSWKAQEASAYLNRVRRSSLDVRRIQDEIEVQRSILPSLDYTRDKIRKSPKPDALEVAALNVLDLIEQFTTELAEYAELQFEAYQAIKQMEDARHRAVLALYYLDGHSWETVGEKLGYSTIWAKQLRAEALPLFWEVMPKTDKTQIPRVD